MTELAQERSDVCLLSGDIGNRMFDSYKEIAPTRFINCGIAEANMMSMAAGMALSGLRPVVYTITPFTTTRCLEQIKVGVAYHQVPVVIVGTGSGLSYSELGATHHSLEDIAIMRCLPGVNIMAPIDKLELKAQLQDALISNNPSYIRIGKKGEPVLHDKKAVLGIGRANMLRQGDDALVISVGPITSEALKAADRIAEEGYSVAVASLGSVKPLDTDFLESMCSRFKTWITVEEHGLIGGIGSALLEWLSENDKNRVTLYRAGTGDFFIDELGNQDYIRTRLGIDSDGLAETFKKSCRDKKQ